MIKLILASTNEHALAVENILERGLGNASLMNQPNIVWFLMYDGEEAVGTAYAYAISDVRLYVNIVFPGEHAHHNHRKQAGLDLLGYLQANAGQSKYELTIPVKDNVKMKYFSQLGFKREGVAKQSIIINGSIADQYHMGLIV